ncbi:MAG: Coenzyme F420 hydrogenase/dehydrogenase, beta subunit C-terminal domain [Desulfobacterales bacterium]|nr:Coenzyme F420 hydrogenase/dehydrogenase, beta subunit C-terminal domain [Desulfobacterales bacterium]
MVEEVMNEGLCTGCGACITGCPYVVSHEGRIVVLDKCTGVEGNGDCYRHCPRTLTDFEALSRKILGMSFAETEIGHYENVWMVRSTVPGVAERSQDGGCVTTLLSLALEEGLVDVVSCSKMDEDRSPHGYLARTREELLSCAGSSYEASYSLEAYRSLEKDSQEKIAVVGLGCQTEALSKIKNQPPKNNPDPQNIKLTIGLFCGWALLPKTFHPFLKDICDVSNVCKFDIPHTPHYSFDALMDRNGKIHSVPLDEIKPYINPACGYCWDMTAELSDISIGSAGSSYPGWNTIVARTPAGVELLKLAEQKKLLAIHDLPEERLNHLKTAALNRKKKALKNIVEKTGSKTDLLYIDGLKPEYTEKLIES